MDCIFIVAMEPAEQSFPKTAVLIEPLYGYSKEGKGPYRPKLREVVREWMDSVNFIDHPERKLIALNLVFHLLTGALFLYVVLYRLSLGSLVFMSVAVYGIITVYNTLWYHRYCSHFAFTFQRPWYALLFLWTNPLVFREEAYAVPHRVHHQLTDEAGDPYGPHLGWLGSYLAVESSQKLNTEMPEEEYESLKRTVAHIGFKANGYAEFQRTGSVENVVHYAGRVLFAQTLWISALVYLGLGNWIVVWYASVFMASFLIRDFNWHGHGGWFRRKKKPGWEFDTESQALNQRFYGYLASEWHDNHHRYQTSANNGFLAGQLDVTFELIKLLWKVGIIASYIDALPQFQKEAGAELQT